MKRTERWGAVLLATALVSGACGERGGGRGAAEPVVRDSAGVTIVENSAPLWRDGEGWRVDDAPALTIGMVEGDEAYQLAEVRHAARLRNGTVAVADGGSQRIRLYDADGRHVRDLGARGAGPGEFESLSLVRPFRGDSIAAWDGRSRRLTVFDAAGQVGRVWTVDAVGGMIVPAVGWFADGSVALMPGMDPTALAAAEPGQRRENRRYLRVRGDGVDTLAALPGRDELVYHDATSFGTRTVLFGRDAYAAARDDAFAAAESGRFEVAIHGADGTVRRIVRVQAEPRPVTAAELTAARERELEQRRESARMMAERFGRTIEEDRSEPPAQTAHPFFDRIELDANGHLWVREPGADERAARRWQVFDDEGRWLGAVTTPAGLRVTDIGMDYVLGVYRDELDVEYVRMHRLSRTRTGDQS